MFEMFAPAAPSFDDPIGLLKACHMRILTNCKTLEKLTLHLAEKGADEEAATAAERVHKYFTTAAPLHHQDEEVDLFPRLRRHDKSLADAIAALESEHQTMAAAWEAIEPDLQDLDGIDDIKAFAQRVATFCRLYRGHIVSEETNCLSPAEELLTAEELKALGEAMEARRA